MPTKVLAAVRFPSLTAAASPVFVGSAVEIRPGPEKFPSGSVAPAPARRAQRKPIVSMRSNDPQDGRLGQELRHQYARWEKTRRQAQVGLPLRKDDLSPQDWRTMRQLAEEGRRQGPAFASVASAESRAFDRLLLEIQAGRQPVPPEELTPVQQARFDLARLEREADASEPEFPGGRPEDESFASSVRDAIQEGDPLERVFEKCGVVGRAPQARWALVALDFHEREVAAAQAAEIAAGKPAGSLPKARELEVWSGRSAKLVEEGLRQKKRPVTPLHRAQLRQAETRRVAAMQVYHGPGPADGGLMEGAATVIVESGLPLVEAAKRFGIRHPQDLARLERLCSNAAPAAGPAPRADWTRMEAARHLLALGLMPLAEVFIELDMGHPDDWAALRNHRDKLAGKASGSGGTPEAASHPPKEASRRRSAPTPEQSGAASRSSADGNRLDPPERGKIADFRSDLIVQHHLERNMARACCHLQLGLGPEEAARLCKITDEKRIQALQDWARSEGLESAAPAPAVHRPLPPPADKAWRTALWSIRAGESVDTAMQALGSEDLGLRARMRLAQMDREDAEQAFEAHGGRAASAKTLAQALDDVRGGTLTAENAAQVYQVRHPRQEAQLRLAELTRRESPGKAEHSPRPPPPHEPPVHAASLRGAWDRLRAVFPPPLRLPPKRRPASTLAIGLVLGSEMTSALRSRAQKELHAFTGGYPDLPTLQRLVSTARKKGFALDTLDRSTVQRFSQMPTLQEADFAKIQNILRQAQSMLKQLDPKRGREGEDSDR